MLWADQRIRNTTGFKTYKRMPTLKLKGKCILLLYIKKQIISHCKMEMRHSHGLFWRI